MSDARAAQQRIEQKWREIESADPFTVLGVNKDASEGDIKTAYFSLAREFHADAFPGVDLGPSKATLDSVFNTIAEAYETLTDPHKRAEWEAGEQLAASGMSTDVGALLDAEQDFTKGKVILERGEIRASIPFFERSVPLNPNNVEWKAHLVFAQWFKDRDKEDARSRAGELEKLYKENERVLDALVFAGRLALEAGDYDRAHKLLGKVLRENPDHQMAAQARRNLQRVEDRNKKKVGFFGRLLGKK